MNTHSDSIVCCFVPELCCEDHSKHLRNKYCLHLMMTWLTYNLIVLASEIPWSQSPLHFHQQRGLRNLDGFGPIHTAHIAFLPCMNHAFIISIERRYNSSFSEGQLIAAWTSFCKRSGPFALFSNFVSCKVYQAQSKYRALIVKQYDQMLWFLSDLYSRSPYRISLQDLPNCLCDHQQQVIFAVKFFAVCFDYQNA